MSLNEIQLKQHCEYIIQSIRIRNKIVILCEGKIQTVEGRLSPQLYKEMEQMPDANFYKACVPIGWRQYRPQFFNCGDRTDVLNTYFKLLDLHGENITQSNLDPNKLFAIVDLDIQVANIENYQFTTTEEIFYHLYEKNRVNDINSTAHRIWVTGLIHKEAYFLSPDIQTVFDNFSNVPIYNSNPVNLENIYLDMAKDLPNNPDLQNHWQRVFNRVAYCNDLDITGVKKFQDSWIYNYYQSQTNIQKIELIIALLLLVKSKNYWKKILPIQEWNSSEQAFRDQLSLEIGKFYSKQECNVKNHIPFFFKTLYSTIDSPTY